MGLRLNHVGIMAKDWNETRNFYTNTLDLVRGMAGGVGNSSPFASVFDRSSCLMDRANIG
jgi:catechol 2,3-dioxygenase-like lactoylglutathione lyase family enzyme